MGNQLCCQQTTSQERKQQMFVNSLSPPSHITQNHSEKQDKSISLPLLSQEVKQVLNQHRPFESVFQAQENIKIKKFGNDTYQGPLDLIGRPTKLGKMYKQNGAFFIGQFSAGKAEGPCFYVMKNGSLYKGQMVNNQAECQNGQFISPQIQYTGGFKNNTFHGKGKQRLRNQVYQFDGIYQNGHKKQGIMKWQVGPHQYVYQGPFNQNNQFHGQGTLVDSQGKYKGYFVNGQKHGFGVYNYNTKLRFQGFYQHNKKQGEGRIYNNDGTTAYKGIFKNGLPNGKGMATSKNGTQFQTEWKDGIDARLL